MATKVHSLHSEQLAHFLQGAIFGAPIVARGMQLMFEGLNTLTVELNDPLVTITFVLPPSGLDVYSFTEIKAQMELQEPLLRVTRFWNRLVITRKVITTPIDLDKLGTANSILGFSSAADTVGVVYNRPSLPPPRFVTYYQIGAGMLQVITDE